MVNSVSNTSAVQTAVQGLQKAQKEIHKAAKEVSSDSLEAEKLVKLEIAKKNAELQAVNLKSAIEASETILDIIA